MVLTQEEQNLGLQQPAGVGQRPRPFYTGSMTPGIFIRCHLKLSEIKREKLA